MNHPDTDAALLQRALLRTAPDHAWRRAATTTPTPTRATLGGLLAHLALVAACMAALVVIVWTAPSH